MSRSGKVTVVGAGFYGSTTALRLAEYDIFKTVVLTDIVEGKSEGLALDINQSRSIENCPPSGPSQKRSSPPKALKCGVCCPLAIKS